MQPPRANSIRRRPRNPGPASAMGAGQRGCTPEWRYGGRGAEDHGGSQAGGLITSATVPTATGVLSPSCASLSPCLSVYLSIFFHSLPLFSSLRDTATGVAQTCDRPSAALFLSPLAAALLTVHARPKLSLSIPESPFSPIACPSCSLPSLIHHYHRYSSLPDLISSGFKCPHKQMCVRACARPPARRRRRILEGLVLLVLLFDPLCPRPCVGGRHRRSGGGAAAGLAPPRPVTSGPGAGTQPAPGLQDGHRRILRRWPGRWRLARAAAAVGDRPCAGGGDGRCVGADRAARGRVDTAVAGSQCHRGGRGLRLAEARGAAKDDDL